MTSNEIIISAPMSFTGSAERIMRLSEDTKVKVLVLVPIIAMAWCGILIWYLMFGILIIPYRLIRRSQRKQKRDILRHNELLEALAKKNAQQ